MTFRTFTGRELVLDALRASDIALDDIAAALSRLCRFGGHVAMYHSVAAHSVQVSELVEASLEHLDRGRRRQGAALALLHDASEAYLGDITRPLKRLPIMAGYRDLEAALTMQIWARFGLAAASQDSVLRMAVTVADDRLCRVEQRDLQGVPLAHPDPLPLVRSMRPREAETLFLERAAALGLE
ncbi:MAG TPA: hypothetical protein PKC83_10910 [Gemmatimonadaceae bacterium]|nr:hypothetical protein [Gemmatimonadaceae bacterium]